MNGTDVLKLIGLCGAAGAGKDTAAAALVEDGWTRIGFADALKKVLYDVDPIVPCEGEWFPLTRIVDEFGWDWAKHNTEARQLLQRLGVAVREHVSDGAWVNAALKDLDLINGQVVFTDARFPNELEMIKIYGGKLILIERPDSALLTGDAAKHISETAWRDAEFDVTLYNTGSVDELHSIIRYVVNQELYP